MKDPENINRIASTQIDDMMSEKLERYGSGDLHIHTYKSLRNQVRESRVRREFVFEDRRTEIRESHGFFSNSNHSVSETKKTDRDPKLWTRHVGTR